MCQMAEYGTVLIHTTTTLLRDFFIHNRSSLWCLKKAADTMNFFFRKNKSSSSSKRINVFSSLSHSHSLSYEENVEEGSVIISISGTVILKNLFINAKKLLCNFFFFGKFQIFAIIEIIFELCMHAN